MTVWEQRSHEERALLNPGFCANLFWHAARGYASTNIGSLSFKESFLILPFILHRETREALPRSTRTSLSVWLNENPMALGHVASLAKLLVPFTKEGLILGGMHGLIKFNQGRLQAETTWSRAVNRALRKSSDEVRECAKKAEFLGEWFARSGSSATVLALIGVRP